MKKLLFIGIGALLLSACNTNNNNGSNQSIANSPAADSTTTDTTANTGYDAALALLNDIPIDKATFKQLYNNCRTKGDEFNHSKFLYDKTAPIAPNSNALFAYLNVTNPGLRLAIQYYAADKLAIRSVTFIIDGETFNYPAQFKTDFGDQHTWEWADEPVTNAQLPMLVKLALGKQVTLQLTGAQGRATKTVTAQQQQLLKNMLILYKGLLMGYNA